MESEVWSVKCGVWSVIWEVRSVVWSGVWGASPNSLYAVRIPFLLQGAQLLRCFQTELKRRTCIVSNLSLACAPTLLSILPLWLPGAPTSDWLPWGGRSWSQNCPQCVSTLLVLLHLCCLHWSWYFALGPQLGIVSHNLCVSSLRRVFLLSFLWPLWDAGFLVFPIPLSTSVTALGQFSFRQVSPLGSPFVSLLVAALQRGNSYAFHVSNDIIRCPLWPQCD